MTNSKNKKGKNFGIFLANCKSNSITKINYGNLIKNNSNRKIFLKNLIIISLFLLISTIAFAIPNSLTLQGKLTNLAGASQQGTFNFSFRIYDAFTDGNTLWELANYNITTDANGVYDVILKGVNLSFADQYYLGITIGTDNESTPRINLTSTPYSFRANISEALNPNASYTITNLSVTGNATFGIDTTTTLKVNGNLNATGNAAFGSSLTNTLQVISGVSSNLVPSDNSKNLGSPTNFWHLAYIDMLTVNNLTAAGTNISGTAFPSFTINSNYSGDDAQDVTIIFERGTPVTNAVLFWDSANKRFDFNFPLFIEANQNLTVDTNTLFVDGSIHKVGIGKLNPATELDVAGGINASTLNISGNVYLATQSGNVGIGTTTPAATLHINSSSVSGALLITNGSSSNYTLFVNASSGLIGIGTTSPMSDFLFGTQGSVSKLTIANANTIGNSTAAGLLLTQGSGFGGGTFININAHRFLGQDSFGGFYISYGLYYDGDQKTYRKTFTTAGNTIATLGGLPNGSVTGSFAFSTVPSGGSVGDSVVPTTRFFIKNDGLIGINTTTPAQTLTVQGTLNVTNPGRSGDLFVASSGNVGIGTTTPDNLLTILGNELTANAILHINASDNFNKSVTNVITLDHTLKNPVNSTGGVGVSILFRASDNASQLYKIGNISAILYNSTNGSQLGALTFSTSGLDTGDGAFGHNVERMRIDGKGNVGINNTAPNETLTVKGTLSVVSGSGAQGLYQDPSGNVGIGTTSPYNTLTVVGSVGVSGSINASSINTTGSAYFATSGVGKVGINTTSPNYVLQTQGGVNLSNAVYIQNNGNVGIGTTSPNDILEVVGNVRVSGSLNATSINASRLFARNGTAALPSYTFIEDTNTGLRLGNNDNISIVTGGSDRLTINSLGNVGIGTANPLQLLHVKVATDQNLRVLSNDRTTIESANDADNGYTALGIDGSSLVFNVHSGGNVGIGTTSPATLLQLAATSPEFRLNASTAGGYIGLKTNSVANTDFDIQQNGTSRVYINPAGNVGIGTTSPYNTLTVVGSVGVSGALNASSINTTGNAYFATSGAGKVGINTTTPAQTLTVQGTLNVTNPGRSGDLFVASSGNVGIGTTAPTKLLSVNGTLNAITLDPSATPNPVINTTGNNITISSASGSVIIRLG